MARVAASSSNLDRTHQVMCGAEEEVEEGSAEVCVPHIPGCSERRSMQGCAACKACVCYPLVKHTLSIDLSPYLSCTYASLCMSRTASLTVIREGGSFNHSRYNSCSSNRGRVCAGVRWRGGSSKCNHCRQCKRSDMYVYTPVCYHKSHLSCIFPLCPPVKKSSHSSHPTLTLSLSP